MRKLKARTLGLGLSALILPACTPDQEFLVPMPAPATTQVTHSLPTTAKRSPQGQAAPVQYMAMQQPPVPGQIVYDTQGRAYQAVAVEPPTPAPAPVPAVTQEPVEVVAVTHTTEPPLAPVPQPPRVAVAKQMPEAPPAPLPAPPAAPKLPNKSNNAWIPTHVPPGSQVLVLQAATNAGESATPVLKPVGHTATESVPSLLTPPVPAEELKLVSVPRTDSCATGCAVINALRAYHEKSLSDAERHLAHLDPVNQQLLKRLLPLAIKLGETGAPAADPGEVADLVDQLQQMLGTLRARAALRIEKLCYCKQPASPAKRGVYQPLSEDHAYRPGESVELYMELRNFTCEAKDREYTTHLSTLIEIRDEQNEVVAKYEFERDKPDAGAAPRTDYFHICRFPVQGLTAGQYTLTATVTDVPSGKSAKGTLPLKVDAAKRVTARAN